MKGGAVHGSREHTGLGRIACERKRRGRFVCLQDVDARDVGVWWLARFERRPDEACGAVGLPDNGPGAVLEEHAVGVGDRHTHLVIGVAPWEDRGREKPRGRRRGML